MRHPIRTLLLILLIPALAYLVLKGWMYYRVKSTVDDVIAQVAHQAEIGYQGIETDLRGSAALTGLTIRPVGASDSVVVERVLLHSDDVMFFLRTDAWGVGEGATPPRTLALTVSGIRAPANGSFLGIPSSGDPCAPEAELQPELFSALGMTELNMDADMAYAFDALDESLRATVVFEMTGIQRVGMQVKMTGVSPDALASGAAPAARLASATLSMRIEPEFGRRRVAVCARRQGIAGAAYTEQMIAAANANLHTAGVLLGSGLSDAMQRFHREWGELEISVHPAEPLGAMALAFLPPEQLTEMLGVSMRLNQQPIADLSFTVTKSDKGLAGMLGMAPEQIPEPPPAVSAPQVRWLYRAVVPQELQRYLHYQVRLQVPGQPTREGILIALSGGQAQLEQRLHGGTVTVYVDMARISKAEARFLEKMEPSEGPPASR